MVWATRVFLRCSMTSSRSLVSLPSRLSTSVMVSQDLMDCRATSSSTSGFLWVRLYWSYTPSRSSRWRPLSRLVSSPFHAWPFAVWCMMHMSTLGEGRTSCFPKPWTSPRVPGGRSWPLSRPSMSRRVLAFRCPNSTSSGRTGTSWRLSHRTIDTRTCCSKLTRPS